MAPILLETYTMATQKATGYTFEPELGPFLQAVLKKVTSMPVYPGKTYLVAI